MTGPGTPAIRESCDVLVVGAGPAGLAAAAEASDLGMSVMLVDERVTLGGQIYKQMGKGFVVRNARKLGRDFMHGRALIDAVERRPVQVRLQTTAVAIEGDQVVLVEDQAKTVIVTARRIVLAPGAYDRPVAFPGWTLPGVLTAGGAQSLVKTQRVLPGSRIVFCGSGPVALAFPAQLHHYGANVVLVCEAGPAPGPRDLMAMSAAAPGNLTLLLDAARYRLELLRARVPLRYRRIVVRAEGSERVEEVVHAAVDRSWRAIPGTEERTPADTLCIGFGFSPSTELLRLAGCSFTENENRGGAVAVVDRWMRSTAPGVLVAGDGTGVEGSKVAEDEGRLAALGAALDLGVVKAATADKRAGPIRRRIARKRAFARALSRMHAVGDGVYELAGADTTICRCEEVTRDRLEVAISATSDISAVKGLTRAGMGLCQGRNCQRQIAAMIASRYGRRIGEVGLATPRAPVRPVPIGAMADPSIHDEGFFVGAR
jgi:D-hydroxyproline dehydrogenase subunit alpha